MKAVGVKALKNNLSRYLKMARDGEIIYVTDREEIIAEIHRPLRPSFTPFSRWRAFLDDQERQKSLRRANHTESRLTLLPGPSINLDQILQSVREDRF